MRQRIVSTKLMMPSPRKNYIRRDRLVNKLNGMCDYKVILVQGAAGSGKTTLLSSFIKEKGLTSYKWITLEQNTSVFSFWYYFVEAVKDYLGTETETILTMMESIVHKDDVEKVVVILINQLLHTEEIIVVLDDFHHISEPFLLQTIQYFLKNASDNIHLIFITREKPDLYFGELHMSGQLLEIKESDLRFSDAEAVSFLEGTMNLDLHPSVIAEIVKQTEGWVGGLQLIALVLANDPRHSIPDIKALNKYIIEYLSKEILDSLPESEKDFLITSCVLSYFHARICNQVLRIDNAQAIIDRLLQKNLFLVEINDGEAYRYHHMFDEFLKLKFSQLDSARKQDIHFRAAKFYDEHGDLDESIKHYLAINNYQDAITVIGRIGQNPKGWSYLSQFPLDWISKNKELALQDFFYHFCIFEFNRCRQIIEMMDSQANHPSTRRLFHLAKGLLAQHHIQVDEQMLTELKKLNVGSVTKAIILLNIAAFLGVQDEYEKALELAEEAVAMEMSDDNPYLQFFAFSIKAQILDELGELKESEAIYQRTLGVIEGYPLLAPLAGISHIGLACVYLKTFQLEKAEQALACIPASMPNGYSFLEPAYYSYLLELKCLRGELQEARELLIEKSAELQKNHLFFPIILKILIFLHVDEGIIHCYPASRPDGQAIRIEDKLADAQRLLLDNQSEEALQGIEEIVNLTRERKMNGYLIQGLLLKAWILDKQGNRHQEILALLVEAIRQSARNRMISPFVFQKEWVRKYVAQLLDNSSQDLSLKEKSFVRELSGILEHIPDQNILTDRETEVLTVLASGATNKEIAQTLHISVATVKTHIINIYAKLGVDNRVEVVNKAKREGLIP